MDVEVLRDVADRLRPLISHESERSRALCLSRGSGRAGGSVLDATAPALPSHPQRDRTRPRADRTIRATVDDSSGPRHAVALAT